MPVLYEMMGQAIRRLHADRRGNVILLFAFSIIPLLAAVGSAVDYSQAARARTHLTQAANVAALAAARTAQKYLNLQGTGSAQFAAASALAQTEMSQVFAANQGSDTYARNVTAQLQMTQASDGSAIATVTASGSAPTSFMKIVGITNVPISASAQATGGAPKYYQIVFLVDISNSMGIGGTAADTASLTNDKLIKCAFACHDANSQRGDEYSVWCGANPTDTNCHTTGPIYCPPASYWTGNNATTNYNNNCAKKNDRNTPYADKRALAKKYGYKLKIDYINDAITAFINQLKPYMVKAPDLFRVSVFTFGTATSSTPIFPNGSTVSSINAASMPTYVSQLQAAAGGIDLETAVSSGLNYGYTYITQALNKALSGTSSVIGDGSSPTKRKTYFILLSDGAEDIPGSSHWNRVVSVDYTTACTAVKQPVDATNTYSNPVIFSIEAVYPPVPDAEYPNDQYTVLIKNKQLDTGIPNAMKACATASTDYFLATDGPAIQAAVAQVFSNIVGSDLHLAR